ncbi:hypothetical protein [Bradyrhizobium sp. 27S5]|uniref:hypothetical protein n=1 Tax=Bradyrhizobium sp. 27S5 TaxID=3139728 RepID=UPI0030CA90BA
MTRQSLSDKRMISELEAGRKWLLSEPSASTLLQNLRRGLQSITRNIYVFHSIPEQYEVLYDVLVDGKIVVHIELPRDTHSDEVVFEKLGIEEYLNTRKHIGKMDRRRLTLALELAQDRARRMDEA